MKKTKEGIRYDSLLNQIMRKKNHGKRCHESHGACGDNAGKILKERNCFTCGKFIYPPDRKYCKNCREKQANERNMKLLENIDNGAKFKTKEFDFRRYNNS